MADMMTSGGGRAWFANGSPRDRTGGVWLVVYHAKLPAVIQRSATVLQNLSFRHLRRLAVDLPIGDGRTKVASNDIETVSKRMRHRENNEKRKKEDMKISKWASIGSFFLAAALCVPAWSQNPNPRNARPGTINYVEGQVAIGNQDCGPRR